MTRPVLSPPRGTAFPTQVPGPAWHCPVHPHLWNGNDSLRQDSLEQLGDSGRLCDASSRHHLLRQHPRLTPKGNGLTFLLLSVPPPRLLPARRGGRLLCAGPGTYCSTTGARQMQSAWLPSEPVLSKLLPSTRPGVTAKGWSPVAGGWGGDLGVRLSGACSLDLCRRALPVVDGVGKNAS